MIHPYDNPMRAFLLMDGIRMLTISAGDMNQPDVRQITFVRYENWPDGAPLPRVYVNKFSIYEDCWNKVKPTLRRLQKLIDTAEPLSIWIPPQYTMAVPEAKSDV